MPEKSDSTSGGPRRGDSAKPFDPRAYLRRIRVRGSEVEYLDVKWRLVWLRSEHPDAHVITDMISNDNNAAVFRAEVTLPNGGRATGYGSEARADFTDYIEKAETKAIGRALAALGYGTQFALDFDTADEAQVATDDVVPQSGPIEPVRPTEPTRVRVVAPPELDVEESVEPMETIDIAPTRLRPVREEVETPEREAFEPADYSWTEFWKWARGMGYDSRSKLGELLGIEIGEMTPHEVRQRLLDYRKEQGIEE